ncbi:MAG: hypothetical protein ABSH28_11185 [Acidobacteriota bacterium]|jgi:hypothetical protein
MASWLLGEVIFRTQTRFVKLADPLRSLEAALFMIGYDLGSSADGITKTSNHEVDDDSNDLNEFSHPLRTRGPESKAKNFRYEHADGNIVIKTEHGREFHFGRNEVEKILLSIYQEFGTEWFPLANNVEKLSSRTERAGLGMILLAVYPGEIPQAQAASYLGPVMEDIGIFEWNGRNKGFQWRLISEPPAQATDLDN